MLDVFIDGDACPVKDETYRVAERYTLTVFVVANRPLHIPRSQQVSLQVVPGNPDAVDDWIAEHASAGDIVITADIPLASRCIKNGARVLGPKGHEFTEDAIGDALATRALMDYLRQMGEITGGPSAMDQKSRSRFLARLDEIVQAIRRAHLPSGNSS
jgi:uncharacterized protein